MELHNLYRLLGKAPKELKLPSWGVSDYRRFLKDKVVSGPQGVNFTHRGEIKQIMRTCPKCNDVPWLETKVEEVRHDDCPTPFISMEYAVTLQCQCGKHTDKHYGKGSDPIADCIYEWNTYVNLY